MKLFRRLLVSLFPEELTANAQHPVTMFLSLISPKQVFSLIFRRVIENYKLNFYDIALDPFEVKIWFGEQPTLQVKDIDHYYAYNVVAQMNGRYFYAPGNLATVVCFVVARQGRHIWSKYDWSHAYLIILSTYLLTFLFAARLRVFPETSKEERHNRFIAVYFSFCELVARQQWVSVESQEFQSLKKELLHEVDLFFFLDYFYQKMNWLFFWKTINEKEFYQRLFGDEIRNKEYKQYIETFITNRETITKETMFWWWDTILGKLIFPTEVPIKYILQDNYWFYVVEYLLPLLFDEEEMSLHLRSFLKNNDWLDNFLQWLCQRMPYQNNFFAGLKKISHHAFVLNKAFHEEKEIDEFMSSLESGSLSPKTPVPESIKKESALMERLMNFYMSFVCWFTVGRWDAFWLRLFKKELMNTLILLCAEWSMRQEALQRYGWLLYTYSKNIFYYAYAYEHIRAWKEVFTLPYKSWYKEVYAHMYLLKLFDEHFVYTIFQDIQQSWVFITVTQKDIVEQFKTIFYDRLRHCLDADDAWLLHYVYGSVGELLGCRNQREQCIHNWLAKEDIVQLKERIYSVDLHIWIHAIELLTTHQRFGDVYWKSGVVWICALLKETLFGFLLYMTYLQQIEWQSTLTWTQALMQMYVLDILQISQSRKDEFIDLLEYQLGFYKHLLQLWIKLDDNQQFFWIAYENRSLYAVWKTIDQLVTDVSGDDIVRCRWFYKTITYYNKRLVKPM